MRSFYWHCRSMRRPAYSCAYPAQDSCSHRKRDTNHRRTWMETRRSGHSRGSADFGVRRPLRYLRYHLDLDDGQSRRVAAILNRVKLEREQAEVDNKRAMHALADTLVRDDAHVEQLRTALDPRVKSAERLQAETARALNELGEVLDADQLQQFADMLRSGLISL